jgi:hypothetical protein
MLNKWPDYKARSCSFGGGGGITVNRAMVFREQIRGFHDLLRENPLFSVDTLRGEVTLHGLPNNTVHISGFRGEDGSIVKLNVVSLVNTVFSDIGLVQMF